MESRTREGKTRFIINRSVWLSDEGRDRNNEREREREREREGGRDNFHTYTQKCTKGRQKSAGKNDASHPTEY